MPSFFPARQVQLALAAVAFALPPASVAAAAPQVHTVVIDKMKFGTLTSVVRAGDTIVWINKDVLKHSATARDKSFNVDLPPKTSGKTVITHSGTIAFYCLYHPGMKGSLTVTR